MKIAILGRRMYPAGGSERSLLYLKEKLHEHNIKIFGYYQKEPTEYRPGLHKMPETNTIMLPDFISNHIMRKIRIPFHIKQNLIDFNPDLVFSQHEMAYLGAYLSEKFDTRHIVFLRDKSQLANIHTSQDGLTNKLLTFIYDIGYYKSMKWVFNNSELIIANSNFTAGQYSGRYPIVDPLVIFPFVKIDEYQTEKGNCILHVNPKKHKGINITLDIAEKLENEDFIIVGPEPSESITKRINTLDNVDYLGYVENMKKVYKQTKLVLYPSKWEEPYGRIPVEAGASGIPTISSGSGGLKESVGTNELIVAENRPENYIHKINVVSDNYQKYENVAKENAVNKSAAKQFKILADRCTGLV